LNMNKVIEVSEAVEKIHNGDIIMVGGFYGIGTAHQIIHEIIRQGKRDLTMITCEGGWPERSGGKLFTHGCLKRMIVSWVGNLSNLTDAVNNGQVELELNPQGTLIERIRAGGSGLGGVLTKAGLGTMIETAQIGEKVHLNGEDWMYHTPLHADFALVGAYHADEYGNLVFSGTENNFNQCICMAADTVIAEIGGEIKKVGALKNHTISMSGIFVDMMVEGWKL
jgi:acetate CoA/acetoacetate CoA-transferase alpha subunit